MQDVDKWKDILCLWIERLNIFKMVVLSKLICWFDAVLINPFAKTDKLIWPYKGLKIAKSILQKKKYFFISKLFIDFKMRQYNTGIRCIDQWNRIENPEVNSYFYVQLIFIRCAEVLLWGNDSVINKRCWESWISTCKKSLTSHNK